MFLLPNEKLAMQRLYRLFYDSHVPMALSTLRMEYGMLSQLLAEVPPGTSKSKDEEIEVWK